MAEEPATLRAVGNGCSVSAGKIKRAPRGSRLGECLATLTGAAERLSPQIGLLSDRDRHPLAHRPLAHRPPAHHRVARRRARGKRLLAYR